jgi:hypothetical protein
LIGGAGHVVGSSNHLAGFVYRGRKMESLEAAPTQAIDDEAGPIVQSGLTAEQEAAEAKLEAEAQAKEVLKPVGR